MFEAPPDGESKSRTKPRTAFTCETCRRRVYRNESEIRNLATGYIRIVRKPNGAKATGEVDAGNRTKFFISDEWSIDGDVLSLSRKVEVRGTAEGAGFGPAIRFPSDPDLTWPDVASFVPSLLYGNATYNGGGPVGWRTREPAAIPFARTTCRFHYWESRSRTAVP